MKLETLTDLITAAKFWGTSPSKCQELDALRILADTLGPDSYLGPWLHERHAELAGMLRSDFLPTITIKESDTLAAQIRSLARSDADLILTQAHKEADKITRQAEDAAAIMRADARAAELSATKEAADIKAAALTEAEKQAEQILDKARNEARAMLRRADLCRAHAQDDAAEIRRQAHLEAAKIKDDERAAYERRNAQRAALDAITA